MNLYVALLRLVARACATLTLASGAAIVIPARALGRRLALPELDYLAVRTDRRLTDAEHEFSLLLPTPHRPLDQRPVRTRPPTLPITCTTFGPRETVR